jgi:hypothetical protein
VPRSTTVIATRIPIAVARRFQREAQRRRMSVSALLGELVSLR